VVPTKAIVFFALLFVPALKLVAQEASHLPSRLTLMAAAEPPPIGPRPYHVLVPVTVTDEKNHPITNLTYQDFQAFEDSQPQPIQYFNRPALDDQRSLRVGVMFDIHGTNPIWLRAEQAATLDFLNGAFRPDKDMGFVVAADTEPALLQDYTQDLEKLSQAIAKARTVGTPRLFDAIYYACKEKLLFSPPSAPPPRRILIIICNGVSDRSEHTAEDAINMALRAEVTIYVIRMGGRGSSDQKSMTLRRLAEVTGGQAFFPAQAIPPAASFQQITTDLRSQYDLAYISTNTAIDGTFRAITITVRNKTFRVRAKSGYFRPLPSVP
jgi:Ca-activated chloride channel family protein